MTNSVFNGDQQTTVIEFFKHILTHMMRNSMDKADFSYDFGVTTCGKPFDAKLNFSVTLDLQLQKNVWIDWRPTPENTYPKLDDDPLVHVKFYGGLTSMDDVNLNVGAQPISYWHDYGRENNFDWDGWENPASKYDIIAYMIVDPDDHD